MNLHRATEFHGAIRRRWPIAAFLAIGLLTSARGQETGALKGAVEGPAGSAVIGAHIALKESTSGKKYTENANHTEAADKNLPTTDTGVVRGAARDTSPAGASLPEVSRIRTWSADTYTRIVIDVGAPVKYQAERIPGPDRIYFDLRSAKVGSRLSRKSIGLTSGSFLKTIRIAQNQADVVRVVFEVNRVKDYSVSLLPDPYRLVVDVYGPAGAPGAEQQEVARNGVPPSPPPTTADPASPAKDTEPAATAVEKSATMRAPAALDKSSPAQSQSGAASTRSDVSSADAGAARESAGGTGRASAAGASGAAQPGEVVTLDRASSESTAATSSSGGASAVSAANSKKPNSSSKSAQDHATADGQGNGAVKGTVEDPAGAAIVGARVDLKNNATGKKFSEVTDEDGYFEVRQLPAGQYNLAVEASGFELFQKPIEVGAKPPGAMLIRMKLPQVSQQVTVSANAEALPSPSALDNSDYLQLDQTSLEHMPIKEGDPLAIPMLFLEPAVLGSQGPQLIVDGVEESTLELPTSAIKEIFVNRSPYSALFARPGNGRIEVTTRQGSRHHYRGTISFIFRNSALDARNPFALTRPLMQRPIGEGQLSGPLSKRITFFVAGRYVHRNQAAVVDAVNPDGTSLIENFPVHGIDAHAFGRLDFRMTKRNQLTLSYKYKDKSRQNQTVGGFDLPSRATDTLDRENEVRLFETATVSESFLNEVQITYKKQSNSTTSLSSDTAKIVLDAFSSGGAQQSLAQTEQVGVIQDIATAVKGRNTLRFGFAARPRFIDAFNASDFGGTYMFSSLADYNANNPYLFTQNQGNPSISYQQTEYSSFIQDEARLRPTVSLSLGARYEFQSDLSYYKNVAPRAGLAFAPGKGETVIRAGAGLFYDRLPDSMEQQSLLYNVSHVLQVAVPYCTPPPLPGCPSYPILPSQIQSTPPSVVDIAPGIRTPTLLQANLSVDRKLGKGRNFLTLDYTHIRGFRLYRLRNINAPPPPAFSKGSNPNSSFTNIDQFESTGSSKSDILTTTLKSSPRPRLDLMVQYTYSHSANDTSGLFSLPANNYDLRPEWGRSDLDRRHRLNLMASYLLPFTFRFGTVVVVNSGIPYNITTGKDTDNDTVANDRPPGVNRNSGNGPGFAQVDVHLSRPFHFEKNKHRPRVELGIDAFNVLNTVNYKDYVGTLTSPFFGRANAANSPREVQLSMQTFF